MNPPCESISSVLYVFTCTCDNISGRNILLSLGRMLLFAHLSENWDHVHVPDVLFDYEKLGNSVINCTRYSVHDRTTGIKKEVLNLGHSVYTERGINLLQ